jgi:hypothetical protein
MPTATAITSAMPQRMQSSSFSAQPTTLTKPVHCAALTRPDQCAAASKQSRHAQQAGLPAGEGRGAEGSQSTNGRASSKLRKQWQQTPDGSWAAALQDQEGCRACVARAE